MNKNRTVTILRSTRFELNRRIPSLTLEGVWLKEYGFQPGDRVEVRDCGDGILLVRKVGSVVDGQ